MYLLIWMSIHSRYNVVLVLRPDLGWVTKISWPGGLLVNEKHLHLTTVHCHDIRKKLSLESPSLNKETLLPYRPYRMVEGREM